MPESGKRADWTYRVLQMALSAAIALGVGAVWDQVKTLVGLSEKVDRLVTDQASLKDSVDDVKRTQEDMKRTQAGFATGAQVEKLQGDLSELKGRVGTLETTVNSLIGRRPPGPPK